MLVDHLGSGFLVGLGLGFLGSGLFPCSGNHRGVNLCTGKHGCDNASNRSLPGLYRDGFVLVSAAIWPYAFAGFLILIGIWFLVKGFARLHEGGITGQILV